MSSVRESLKDKNRIVIKIGTAMLTHPETGYPNLLKMEQLVRELCDLKNRGKDVILVTSGAIAAGRKALGLPAGSLDTATKQACASVGQGRLMMLYEKLFSEYNQVSSQILMTKNNLDHEENRSNIVNTFERLLSLGVIPIVNENDTVSTFEMQFGDNDTLSALVTRVVQGDLLILLSDIDGLYTDDPHENPDASLIETVEEIDDSILSMGKSSPGSPVGTGGMSTKLSAAKIATGAGAHMIIANGKDVGIIHRIINGRPFGTLFIAKKGDRTDV